MQIAMFRERIRTIGISLLGGNSGVEGPYELNIDSIRAVNEEDVTSEPSKSLAPSPSRITNPTLAAQKGNLPRVRNGNGTQCN